MSRTIPQDSDHTPNEQTHVVAMKMMSGPRFSLPLELVHKILVGCLLDPEFYTDPFDLARVCRQWRGVVYAENSLWETLHMTWIAGPSMHYYLLHPCMRIAPFRTQTEDMGTSRDFLKRAQDWLGRSQAVDAKVSLSLESDGTEPQSLLPTLFARYRNRLHRLSLIAPLDTLARFLRCIKQLREARILDASLVPNLEYLEIRHAYRSSPGATLRGLQRIDLSQWTALKSLRLYGSRSTSNHSTLVNCMIVSKIPYDQIVSLYLEDRKLAFSVARNIFERCGSLEEFSGLLKQDDNDIEVLPFHATTLPKFRIMHLQFLPNSNACGSVARFFSGLHTPDLKELTIDAQYGTDESSIITSMLFHMLQPMQNRHPIEALTLIIDLDMDSILYILRELLNLKHLRLCAPVRGTTYLRCGYMQLLEILTQRPNGQAVLPLLEEIFIEDNVSSEFDEPASLVAFEGSKIDPEIFRHLGLFAIQSLVESRCASLSHIRCVSVIWKNVGQSWPLIQLDTGNWKYKCPYNHPTLNVRGNTVEIVVKSLPHRQRV